MVAAEDLVVDRRLLDLRRKAIGNEEVVDAPACIRLTRLAKIRPPCIDARLVGVERTERVGEARYEKLRHLLAFLVGEACILAVRLGILEVDFRMRDVEIAADNDGLLRVERQEVGAKRLFPLHAVGEALKAALRIRRVDRHEVEFIELQRDDPSFVIVLFDADPIADGKRLDAAEDSRS